MRAPKSLPKRVESPSFLFLAMAIATLSACGGCEPETPADAGVDAGTQCAATFSFRPSTTASSVFVIGEWNGFDRTAHRLDGPDATGSYSLAVELPIGEWGYAFLVDGAVRLDPANERVRQVAGSTYSLISVTCGPPPPGLAVQAGSVVVERPAAGSGSFTVSVDVVCDEAARDHLRVEGTVRVPDDDGEPHALTDAELSLNAEGTVATVTLQGLDDGKYTVRLRSFAGQLEGEDLVLPFWIEASKFSFYDSPIYMVMTDRFRDGDMTNNPAAGENVARAADFQGGDLKGVELAIREGYFDKLGIRAMWLTPWQTQPEGSYLDDSGAHQVKGYHGYWPIKAREVDPRFGGNDALRSMVREAHRHGIRILMDTVVNHVHQEHEYFKDPAKAGWFRTDCVCGTNGCGWDEKRLSCLFTNYMPDINWTNRQAALQFVADVLWWVEEFELDGLRVDAVKHVEDEAVTGLATAMRKRFETVGTDYYMFGETFSDDYGLLKHYIGPDKLDGQFDFPRFMKVPEPVFATAGEGLLHAKYWTEESIRQFGDATMVTFIGSHDVPRFITKADPSNSSLQGNKWENLPGAPVGQEPYDRLWLAMLHLVTTPGVPLLYYGDEYGEFGGSDPDNRHFANQEATLWPAQQAQLERTRKLLKGRESLRGLARGSMQSLWCNSESSGKGDLWAYVRPDPDANPKQTAVVVLNARRETWTDVAINDLGQFGWNSGTVYDLLTGREWSLANGSVTLDVPGFGGVVLGLR